MKKKGFLVLLLLGNLSSCSSQNYEASPEMKAFFGQMNAEDAFSYCQNAQVDEKYHAYNGENVETGSKIGSYQLSHEDNVYYLHKCYEFTGSFVENGVTKTETLLTGKAGSYKTWTLNNDDITTLKKETTSDGDALSAVRDEVYYDTGNYKTGPLYYGDIFMINSNVFPNEAFVISSDGLTITFDYLYAREGSNDSGNKDTIIAEEKTSMNKKGLVTSAYERVTIKSSGDTGKEWFTPTYNEKFDKLTSIGSAS